jgi:hypothetical protein
MFKAGIHKKKYLPVFFILVIFMPMMVSVALLVWQQVIHFEMMEELEAKNLTAIIIKKSSLKWTRTGKEIEINGNLFDVDDISIKGDSCIIKGLYDEKEEALLQTIKKSQQESPYNKPLQLLISKVFSHVLFIEDKKVTQPTGALAFFKNYYSFNSVHFSSFSSALNGPPPKYS